MDETAKKILIWGGVGLLVFFVLTSANNGDQLRNTGPGDMSPLF